MAGALRPRAGISLAEESEELSSMCVTMAIPVVRGKQRYVLGIDVNWD
jgi:hypothetical protein